MQAQLAALLIQECAHLFGDMLRNRKGKANYINPEATLNKFLEPLPSEIEPITPEPQPEQVINIQPEPKIVPTEIPAVIGEPNKAQAIATGCIPCSLGHVGTCSGLLNEAMRFANKDGVGSPEVIDRVNMCLDELNAMERVDMRPEMISQLNGWEKELAEKVLTESRGMRHGLEAITSVDELEKLAARTQTTRRELGQSWFKEKLKVMSPEDKAEVSRRVMAKLQQMAETPAEPEDNPI